MKIEFQMKKIVLPNEIIQKIFLSCSVKIKERLLYVRKGHVNSSEKEKGNKQ